MSAAPNFTQALLPALLPGVQLELREQVGQLRQALAVWTEGLQNLERTLSALELFCGGEPEGSSTASSPEIAALLPVLQTLLARSAAGGGDLGALAAHPALAGLLGRQL